MTKVIFLFLLAAPVLTLAAPNADPIVIGHRGAPGHVPEHTLAGYEMAIDFGADFIEPDLVMTKDGVLIARHENDITETTDVANKFADRKKTKTIDGQSVTGWFTEDFTLSEIKKLRAKERLAFRNQSKNGLYEIPTLQEILDLVKRKEKQTGRRIGLYPETKHSTYFRDIRLPLEETLLQVLNKNGYQDQTSPVFIQSFEVGNLKKLHGLTRIRLVQLLSAPNEQPYDWAKAGDKRTYGSMLTLEGLKEIASYAQGIGPAKQMILPEAKDGKLAEPTPLIGAAHAVGLLVHPYTFRSEKAYLPAVYQEDPVREYQRFYELCVDGLFSDFPDVAVRAKKSLKPGQRKCGVAAKK